MDAAAWDQRHAATAEPRRTEANESVVAVLHDVTPGSALDLGAGAGRHAIWLAQQGWDVRAVDFSTVALDRARRLAQQQGVTIDTEVADVTNYEPEPLEWDLVLLSYLQLPTDLRHALLTRASHWLRPGGLLLVVGHDRANIGGGYGGPRSPDVSYTPHDTVAALDRLTIKTAETVSRQVRTSDSEQTALDTLVLATRDLEQH